MFFYSNQLAGRVYERNGLLVPMMSELLFLRLVKLCAFIASCQLNQLIRLRQTLCLILDNIG